MIFKCFLLNPIGQQRRSLRRYASGDDRYCPHTKGGLSYDNADIWWEDCPSDKALERSSHASSRREMLFEHPSWPRQCHCGYIFADDDYWQVFQQELYRRSDNDEVITLRDASVGAMWWAPWLAGSHSGTIHQTVRGNGPHLIVKTPGGDWDIDSPASNGPDGWTREGEPPVITARPSIGMGPNMSAYHGWLTNGVLSPA